MRKQRHAAGQQIDHCSSHGCCEDIGLSGKLGARQRGHHESEDLVERLGERVVKAPTRRLVNGPQAIDSDPGIACEQEDDESRYRQDPWQSPGDEEFRGNGGVIHRVVHSLENPQERQSRFKTKHVTIPWLPR